jgi:PIN domain nuclease of toxin-antitoxin system
VNLLLDTHVALWTVTGSSKLRPDVIRSIRDPNNTVFVSVATIWEIAIKFARNRGMPDDMPISGTQARDVFKLAGYQLLRIEPDHAAFIDHLPALHGDPFDRLIVAQCKVDGLTLITRDSKVAAYDPSIMLI